MSIQQPKQTAFLTNKMPMLPRTLANVPTGSTRTVSTTAPTAPLTEAPWRLVLYIGHTSSTATGLELNGSVVVGRHDHTLALSPEFDLTPYGAVQAGVSRRHARLFIHDRGLYIQDLGSTNGTFINERQLQPESPYRLHDGDLIDFADLRARLSVIRMGY
jgi:hypothetical protein